MRNPHFNAQWWIDTDAAAIENYNRRAGAAHRLHTELGPQPWEGDPLAASIVVLVQNPSWDATSTLDDHVFHREGWPASSLHPEAPAGMRVWAMGMVKELVAQYGAQQSASASA